MDNPSCKSTRRSYYDIRSRIQTYRNTSANTFSKKTFNVTLFLFFLPTAVILHLLITQKHKYLWIFITYTGRFFYRDSAIFSKAELDFCFFFFFFQCIWNRVILIRFSNFNPDSVYFKREYTSDFQALPF